MDISATTLDDYTSRIAREIRMRSRHLSLPPHQARALRVIAEAPIRLAVLADHLRVSPRAVTDVVDSLTKDGYITVSPDPTDRRAKISRITDVGSALAEELRTDRARIANDVFAPLTPAQRQQLGELLEIVLPSDR